MDDGIHVDHALDLLALSEGGIMNKPFYLVPVAGESIGRVIIAMIAIAKELDCKVMTDFNETRLKCTKDSLCYQVYKMYLEKRSKHE